VLGRIQVIAVALEFIGVENRAVVRAGKDLRRERRVRGMFADDVDRYLREIKDRVTFTKDREREIRAWLTIFGHRHRHTIQPKEIKEQLQPRLEAGDGARGRS
jgi:hypothetical protein